MVSGFSRLVRGGRGVVWVAALLAAALLSPPSYANARARRAFVLRAYRSLLGALPAFLLLSSCLSSVLMWVVATAAQEYGLSRFALEVIVRVLVIELVPLLAALFVLVEVTLPAAAGLVMRGAGSGHARADEGPPGAALPHALAGLIAPLVLSVLASWIALALGYLELYGTNPWALHSFARTLGNLFEPRVALLLVLKLCAFSATVSLLPIAAALLAQRPGPRADAADFTLTTLIRCAALLLLVELLALLAGYA